MTHDGALAHAEELNREEEGDRARRSSATCRPTAAAEPRAVTPGQILVDVSERVMTITLNRPERLNAWTGQMGEELIAALDRADDDDDVRAVIVTGAGRGFCAGADLSGGGATMTLPMDIRLAAPEARFGFVFARREIADNTAPVSVALARRMMWEMLGAEHPMLAHRADSRAMLARGQSADAREGVTSFLEKRPAAFPDRISDGLPELRPGWAPPDFA